MRNSEEVFQFVVHFFGSSPEGFEDISQHGWFRNLETTWNHETQAKVASHKSYKGEYKSFPWWLVANIAHEVTSHRNEDILDTRLKLYRVSSEGEMPINIAFHPYFKSDGKRDVFINGEKHVVDVSTKAKCVKINSNDEIIIDTGKFRIKMILSGYDYDTCLYLWGDAEEYFCVEPVLTSPSCFNTKDGVWLDQKQSIEVSMKLSILF